MHKQSAIKYLLILFFNIMSNYIEGQNRIFNITVESEEGTVVGCIVSIPQLNKWAISDTNGIAQFTNLPQGIWDINCQMVGYRCLTDKINVADMLSATIKLTQETYELDDVVVTAKSGATIGTSSHIDRTALEHQQTVSIVDALQLLPGQLTQNPSLSKSSVLSIRETNTDNQTTALGTSLIIDGANINNDANLQLMSTSTLSTLSTSATTGVDVRSISTDRIESVEVIRGIASAEYGNITSGAVLINTRIGAMPLSVIAKTDPRLKSISISKGFDINKRGGAISADADIAICKEDERINTKKFRRITTQIAYTDNIPISDTHLLLNFKLNGFLSKNINESDPDYLMREYNRSTDNSLLINSSLRWILNKKYLTSVKINASSSFGHQIDESLYTHIAEMPIPYTYSEKSGEHIGMYYPINYDEKQHIDGRPINVQLKALAIISNEINNCGNSITIGGEWNAKGNKGEGKTGEYLQSGYRPRLFSDIPFIYDYSAFAEDKIHFPLGRTLLNLQMGVRMTGIDAKGYKFGLKIDPRFNISYTIFDKRNAKVMILGAWGIQTKLPTLVYLYPDPAYYDQLSYSYVDKDYSKSFALFTTLAIDNTENKDIDLPRSRNYEIGIQTKIHNIKIDATFFNEKLRKGYSLNSTASPFSYKVYESTLEPTIYENETLKLINGKAINYDIDTAFITYNKPSNGMRIDKYGIEYTIDFGKIKSINTQFILDGAYMDIKRYNNATETYYISGYIGSHNRKYAAKAASRATSYNLTYNCRLNTNLRVITRIPRIGLVCTIKGQCVWIDRNKYDCVIDGESIINKNDDGSYYIYPLALIDFNGKEITNLPNDIITNSQTNVYVHRAGKNLLLENRPKPYAMLDIRLTKKIGKHLLMSFYTNNFTNSRPERYLASSDTKVIKNTNIYFGCDLDIKL